MKLVELLAKEMHEWPKFTEGGDSVEQDYDNSVIEGHGCGTVELFMLSERASDFPHAHVTRAQWQAERDRQKGGEWKRHRGGKQPVLNEVFVEYKLRDGVTGECRANQLDWFHDKSGHDVMQYKVISQPQAEEVEMVSAKTIEAMDATDRGEGRTFNSAQDLYAALDITSKAKIDQIDGPIKWRDTVNELDAYIEEFTREREALINRLALEGFALIPAMTPVMGVADIVFPIEEWQIGDIVEVISVSGESGAPLGVFKITDIDSSEPKYELDDSYFPNHNQMKFIRRP